MRRESKARNEANPREESARDTLKKLSNSHYVPVSPAG